MEFRTAKIKRDIVRSIEAISHRCLFSDERNEVLNIIDLSIMDGSEVIDCAIRICEFLKLDRVLAIEIKIILYKIFL